MAGFLDTLFSGGAAKDAAQQNDYLLGNYKTQGLDALSNAYGTGQQAINQGIQGFQPLAQMGQQYGQAGNLYLNALGVNGPSGTAAATNAFQTNPGYALSQAAGEDAINRQRGATGMYNSGNAGEDLLKFGQNNLYQTQYAPWMAGLQSAGQTGVAATGAAATGAGALDQSLAQLAQGYGQNQVGVLGNVTSGGINANNTVAADSAAGAKNLLGAGLSLATLGMGGMGGMGMGGLGSALGGMMPSYGGSASSPLPGLSASDYGQGARAGGLFASYGLG